MINPICIGLYIPHHKDFAIQGGFHHSEVPFGINDFCNLMAEQILSSDFKKSGGRGDATGVSGIANGLQGTTWTQKCFMGPNPNGSLNTVI